MSATFHGRQEYGASLRRLREEAGLTGSQLAASLHWAQSKVSRIETGKQSATTDDVVSWVRAVGQGSVMLVG